MCCRPLPASYSLGQYRSMHGIFDFRKDNDAGSGLPQGADLDLNDVPDLMLGVIDDNHGAVIEIPQSLPFFLALAADATGENVSRDTRRPQRIAELGHIDAR